tara:strand:- start:149 stop:322 length:174 start_codon:yes stop_codon:yes gene_type:complete
MEHFYELMQSQLRSKGVELHELNNEEYSTIVSMTEELACAIESAAEARLPSQLLVEV